jgi:hypothetical protein
VLQETARKKVANLKVTDIHWYEAQSNNIRLPSRTEISEVKLATQEEPETPGLFLHIRITGFSK